MRDVVPILHAAGLAGPVVDGRLIPVLILDATSKPEVAELIRVHQHLPPGDVSCLWGRPDTDNPHGDALTLMLEFQRPIETTIVLRFSIEHQALLIDLMVTASAVYLQVGHPGDRLLSKMNEPRILVELAGTGFAPVWEELLVNRTTEMLRSENKSSRGEAETAALKLITEMRERASFRMPGEA